MKMYVCKEKLKAGLLAIILELIYPMLIALLISFLAEFDDTAIVISAVLGALWISIVLTITILELRQYLGRISIEKNRVALFLFQKEYSIDFGKICIMYIEPEKVSRFSQKKTVSIKLRIKGEKNVIPIKIMNYEIIKELFNVLKIRKEPQDYKFEWEE